jgi:predicted ferric reductase
MNLIFSTIFWFSIYLALVLAPLLVLLIGPVPPGSGFWWDLSMALGFTGLAMMGAQFLLTARFRRVSAPYGIDIIFYFHRYLGVIAFVLILIHYLIIRIHYPTTLGIANPVAASWHMTAGRVAVFAFAIILVTSLFRKPLSIEYDYWRILHVFLATTGILLALGHIQGVSYYIDAPGNRLLWAIYNSVLDVTDRIRACYQAVANDQKILSDIQCT